MLPTYDYLVVEYAGMPDMPAYLEGVRHKEKVYRANGIAAIFLYPQDLMGPDWPEMLAERIEEYKGGQRSSHSSQHPQPERLLFG